MSVLWYLEAYVYIVGRTSRVAYSLHVFEDRDGNVLTNAQILSLAIHAPGPVVVLLKHMLACLTISLRMSWILPIKVCWTHVGEGVRELWYSFHLGLYY
jgi:hypothetical protein